MASPRATDDCYEKSGFYRERWDAAGVNPDKISSLDDLRRIPVLRKQELRIEQAEHPPFGRYLCVPRSDVLRVHGTSGNHWEAHCLRYEP
jgi:phenylacetate-CoA ligase